MREKELEKMQDLLEKLREAKEAKYLSYQDIVNITEKNGEAVSMSTVKRLFSKDADISDFRYNQTIRPVARAVLGLNEETEEPAKVPDQQQAEQYYTTIEALKAVIDFKREQVTELTAEVEQLKLELKETQKNYQKEIETIRAGIKKELKYLKTENERLLKIIDKMADK